MILGELGFIPSQKIGFYCNDPKISYKFTGDTVSSVMLIVITVTLPALVVTLQMWVTELAYYNSDSYKNLECKSSSRNRQFWQWYGYYTLGWWYLLFIVEILKVVVGEPRPHFIDSCRPREITNCTNEYRRLYTCTNTELSWFYVNDSDKSFPSGHAATSIFTATFLVWYMQKRIPDQLVMILIKPWLQCLAILWGISCSMSRITDNRHHWWDVACGLILGVGFGVFVVCVLCKQFSPMTSDAEVGPTAKGAVNPMSYANAKKRHQSVKKLLNDGNGLNGETPEGRELGDVHGTWTA
ncbi:PREDICTED: uncharacterized protein T28D9.3-like [Ceratosolen solmsi marchali]|uniref:Uncharacterized protein T28D9.3-like n=1 Tax=Ceratosolen solmsi marchali TaxID=326594 RepID=A0AAJ6VKX2_9HYME|nr:PREDICTED: uncharacterized protein T28D9.3-like [Ceratosolen solmsi marchali]